MPFTTQISDDLNLNWSNLFCFSEVFREIFSSMTVFINGEAFDGDMESIISSVKDAMILKLVYLGPIFIPDK